MKQILKLFYLSTLAVVVLLSSCSKVPKYAKLIPDDAYAMYRIDAKQIIEKSGVGDDESTKDMLQKMLKESNLSKSTRDKIEAIVDDPANLGLDLRDPVTAFAFKDGKKDRVSVAGTIYKRDNFTEFLNALAKESDSDKVREKKDISYVFFGKTCIAYNDDYFLVTEKNYSEDESDLLDAIAEQFGKEGKGTMAESDDMKQLCSRSGIMQLMLLGSGLEDIMKNYRVKDVDVDFSKISYLMDLSSDNGELTLTAEAITDDQKWNEYFSKYSDYAQETTDALCDYIPDAGFSMFANIKGEALVGQLEDWGAFKGANDEQVKMIKKVLDAVDGDVAFSMSDIDIQSGMPVVALYAKTANDDIIKVLDEQNPDHESVGGNSRIVTKYNFDYNYLGDMTRTPVCFMDYGTKSGITGFYNATEPKLFQKASNAISADKVKGKSMYMYLSVKFVQALSEKLMNNEMQKTTIGKILKLFTGAEAYADNPKKAVVKLYMSDNSKNPLSMLADALSSLYKDYINGKLDPAEPAEAIDTVAVDSVAVDTAYYEDYAVDSVADDYGY